MIRSVAILICVFFVVQLDVALIDAKAQGTVKKKANQNGNNKPTDAESVQQKTVARNNAVVHFERGLEHQSKGEYDQAIAEYDQAIKLKPDFANAYFNRGLSYDNKESIDRAIAEYKRFIQPAPEPVSRYSYRGSGLTGRFDIQRRKQRLDRAIGDFNKAIEIGRGYSITIYVRGLAYHSTEDFISAMYDYHKALALDEKELNRYGVNFDEVKDKLKSAKFSCSSMVKLALMDPDSSYERLKRIREFEKLCEKAYKNSQ